MGCTSSGDLRIEFVPRRLSMKHSDLAVFLATAITKLVDIFQFEQFTHMKIDPPPFVHSLIHILRFDNLLGHYHSILFIILQNGETSDS